MMFREFDLERLDFQTAAGRQHPLAFVGCLPAPAGASGFVLLDLAGAQAEGHRKAQQQEDDEAPEHDGGAIGPHGVQWGSIPE